MADVTNSGFERAQMSADGSGQYGCRNNDGYVYVLVLIHVCTVCMYVYYC